MRAFVAVTDGDWYRYLAGRRELTEANFWRPGGHGRFRALAVEIPAFHIVRFSANRIVEWWGTADLRGALEQLGARILPPA